MNEWKLSDGEGFVVDANGYAVGAQEIMQRIADLESALVSMELRALEAELTVEGEFATDSIQSDIIEARIEALKGKGEQGGD